jgi:hypothetical protein
MKKAGCQKFPSKAAFVVVIGSAAAAGRRPFVQVSPSVGKQLPQPGNRVSYFVPDRIRCD